MENKHVPNGFQYTYSASEQTELRHIREKYTGREEDKMERLRRLDNRVTQRAQMWALVLGVLGTLILGFGMSLILSDLGAAMGMPHLVALILGCLFGLFGAILMALAYPTHNFVLRREREKIAPEIIRLTDELMK